MVDDRSVANRRNTHRSSLIGQLVEDPVRPHPQRIQAAQPSSQWIPRLRFTLEQAQDILDCIDQRPPELEKLTPNSTRED